MRVQDFDKKLDSPWSSLLGPIALVREVNAYNWS